MTIYDPRNATDYQCGLKDCDFKDYLDGKLDISEHESANSIVSELVSDAINSDNLIIGPAITPRLIINVYNKTSKSQEELLGSCQLSISSVLSGVGVSKPRWVKITHTIEKEKGQSTLTDAGDLLVELNFRQLLNDDEKTDKLNDDKSKPSRRRSGAKSLIKSRAHSPSPPSSADSTIKNLVKKLLISPRIEFPSPAKVQESTETRTLRIEIEMKERHIKEVEAEEKELSERYKILQLKAETLKHGSKSNESKIGTEIEENSEIDEENLAIQSQVEEFSIQISDFDKILGEKEALISANKDLHNKHEKLKQALAMEMQKLVVGGEKRLGKVDSKDNLSDVQDINKKLVDVLNNRFSRKLESHLVESASKSHPTDILSKLLIAESDRSDGIITIENLCNVFNDLDINLSQIMASKLMEAVSDTLRVPINENCIAHDALIDYFKTYFLDRKPVPLPRKLIHDNKQSRRHTDLSPRSNAFNSRANASAAVDISANLNNLQRNISPPPKLNSVSTNSSDQQRNDTTAAPSNHSHRHPPSQPTPSTLSALSSASSAVQQTALSKDSSADYLINLRASSTLAAQPLPPPSQAISWATMQLPSNWERRYLKEKNKYYYVNHESKTTQWHHPLDMSNEKS